ncbi:MAG: DNA polymerase III subunit delta [Terriglobia bacterium]
MADRDRKKSSADRTVGPVALVHGSDRGLVERYVDDIEAQLAEGGFSVQREEFDGETASLGAVVQAALTIPLVAGRRLIIVRRADKMALGDVEAITDYFDKSVEDTYLIFAAGKVDRRTAFYRLIKSKGHVEECKISSRAYPKWVADQFHRRGKGIDAAAARMLIENVGADAERLSSEIEKITVSVGDRATIEPGDVAELVARTSEGKVFDLVDCLGSHDRHRAIGIIDALIRGGESPQFIIYMIMRQFKLLLRTRALVKRSQRTHEIRYLEADRTKPQLYRGKDQARLRGPFGS